MLFKPVRQAEALAVLNLWRVKMHGLRTIIRINNETVEPVRNDINSQAKWILSLLNILDRKTFITSGKLPESLRKLAAARGIDVSQLETRALEVLHCKSPQQ